MSFESWLDARDSAAVERAWATLGATRVTLGEGPPRYLGILPVGAARLAAAVLGGSPERFAWFAIERYVDPAAWPAPTFREGRAVSRSFLDGDFALDQLECDERWEIRETVDGPRGVQHITVDCTWGPMTREGGEGRSVTVIRVFDRSARRAVSIPLYGPAAWLVGELDLTPLDLFSHHVDFALAWPAYTIEAVRGVLAQLTADLDAHFDTSATWPGVVRDELIERPEYDLRVLRRIHRFASGAFALELDERLDPDAPQAPGALTAKSSGLPWGHAVRARIESTDDPVPGVTGSLELTLPRAQLDATLARLAAIPGIRLRR